MKSLLDLVPFPVALTLACLVAAQEPAARAFHAVAYDAARARTVLFGGWTGYVSVGVTYSDTWEFDGDNWSQVTASTASPPARQNHRLVYDAARALTVLFGGEVNNAILGDTWEFDGSQWHPVSTASSPSPRCRFGLAYDSDRQRSVLFGGTNGPLGSLGDTWEYDGVNWMQMQPTTAPSPRDTTPMVFDPARRCTVLFGGFTWSLTGPLMTLHDDTWEYAQGQWRLATPHASPPARYHHAMAYDSSRLCMMMAGGVTANGYVGDAWEFDGVTWSQSAVTLPSRLYGHALAYEPVTGRRILIGGATGRAGAFNYFAQESDGGPWGQVQTRVIDQTVGRQGSWAALQPAMSPGARAGVAIAHDSTRHRTVIWGGSGSNPPPTDTWEFDGSTWTQVMTVNAPPPAAAGVVVPAVFDVARNRTVLVTADPNTNLVQTWEYDGVDWTLHPTATAPSAPGVMTYDIARARSVLVTDTQTWEYDGVDWVLATPAPPALSSTAFTYDAHRERAVLLRSDNLTHATETWEYDGATWVEVAAPIVPSFVVGACFDVSQNRVVVTTDGAGTWGYDGAGWELLSVTRLPSSGGLAYDQVLQRPFGFGGVELGLPIPTLSDTTQVLQPPTPPIPPPATWVRHGSGCAGSGGTPNLGPLGNAIPAMGSTFVWQVNGLPPTNSLVLLSFGFGISRYQGRALPLALDQLGVPDCQLWIEPEDGLYVSLPNSGGLVLYGLRIPNAPALAGQVLSSQAVVLDPLAASGIDSVSNAGIMQIR